VSLINSSAVRCDGLVAALLDPVGTTSYTLGGTVVDVNSDTFVAFGNPDVTVVSGSPANTGSSSTVVLAGSTLGLSA